MPGQGESANCKQEGKQDGYKKLQADPWNFPERIFVVEDRKMVCVR